MRKRQISVGARMSVENSSHDELAKRSGGAAAVQGARCQPHCHRVSSLLLPSRTQHFTVSLRYLPVTCLDCRALPAHLNTSQPFVSDQIVTKLPH